MYHRAMKRVVQAASNCYGCGSCRSSLEPLPPANDDDEALRDAICHSYTFAETDTHQRHFNNVVALHIGLEESERLVR